MIAVLMTSLSTAASRADQTDYIVFDVELRGIRAGELAINGKIAGNNYGANGVLQTVGLVGFLRKIRYDASITGRIAAGRFVPILYSEQVNTPKRQSSRKVVYRNGTPSSVSRMPPRQPRPSDVDPTRQGGTVDPLTALYAVLRTVPRADACKLDVKMYDGARRSQARLFDPRPDGKGVVCSGEYRRLEGFSKQDMTRKSSFPFTLHYRPAPDGRLWVDEIETDTVYGKGRLKRR